MSETVNDQDPRPLKLEIVIIAVICVLAIGAGWYLFSQRQQELRSSPSGLDGLQIWLASNGVSALNFSGGWLIDQTAIGLLVLPVYDTFLDQERKAPETKEELLQQQDEYDLESRILAQKAERVPSLIVLPKWRSGMRLTGLAHPVLNVEQTRLQALMRQLTGDRSFTTRGDGAPFKDFRYRSKDGEELTAQVYAAQMFTSKNCTPILGSREAMLLADCPLDAVSIRQDDRVLVLSDPDLLNNHGLRLGDNAKIVLDLIRSKAGEHNVIIDYSRSSWLRDPASEPERERTWDDLLRFFGPPFLTLWVGAAVAMALFLWRGAIRYGPIRTGGNGPGTGKLLAVRARARLMRLSGQDGALVRDYAAARLTATAAALFGPAQARHYAGEQQFLEFAGRRYPAEAPRLRKVLNEIHRLPDRLPAAGAIHLIDELEQVLEQMTHDA